MIGAAAPLAAACLFALRDAEARLAATPAHRLIERGKIAADRDFYRRALEEWGAQTKEAA